MSFKNFTTISATFLTTISINLFASDPCKGMFRYSGEEEESKPKLTIQKSQKEWEETKATEKSNTSSSRPVQQDSLFGVLPDDTLLYIFSLLRVEDLGSVSQIFSHWRKVCSTPHLWEKLGLKSYRDYFSMADLVENPKEKVIHHYLSVILNTKENLDNIKRMKEKYDLRLFIPYFKFFLPHLAYYKDKISEQLCNLEREQRQKGVNYGRVDTTQDNNKKIVKLRQERDAFIKQAIAEPEIKTVHNPYYKKGWWERNPVDRYNGGGNAYVPYDVWKNPTNQYSVPNKIYLNAAKEINEDLIKLEDEDAILKKTKELGAVGYQERIYEYHSNHIEYNSFLEDLCKKGNVHGFQLKLKELKGENLKKFVEEIIENQNFMVRNIGRYLRSFGLKYGELGYEKNRAEAIEYIKLYKIPY